MGAIGLYRALQVHFVVGSGFEFKTLAVSRFVGHRVQVDINRPCPCAFRDPVFVG